MEIRHLRLIEAVAEKGNLSKAVDQLNVSASALSHQLKEVEKELGLSLFHRMNKKLILSDAGRVLLKSARKILRELEQAEQQLKQLREGNLGSLRITTECHTCYHWLPGVLKNFSREYPQVNISIHPEHTRNPVSTLLKGEVDMVISCNVDNNPLITYHELFRDEQFVIVPKGHPWEKKAFVEAQDFKDQHVLIYSGPLETVWLFTNLLIPKNIDPAKITEIPITEAQIEMIKAGHGITAMAGWIVAPFIKHHPISAIPITKNGLHRTWHMAFLKNEKPPGYYDYFMQNLVRQMRSEV